MVLAAFAVACGGKGRRDAEAPSWMEEDVEPAREAAAGEEVGAEPAAPVAHAEARPEGAVMVAGHAAARYELVIPAGLVRLGGMISEGHEQAEVDAAGPVAVGMPGQVPIAFDAIAVFSDPLGLGIDMITAPAEERADMVRRYDQLMHGRFPSALPARLVRVGAFTAIRIDMPRVEMRDRPVRAGRHYLLLDGTATASVDCLWTKENAERMAAACDAVTSSLRRRR